MVDSLPCGRINCWLDVTESCVVYSNWKALADRGFRWGESHDQESHGLSKDREDEHRTYNMRNGLSAVNGSLHDAILVDTNRGQHVEGVLIAGVDTIEDQTTHDLLPGRSTLVPELRLLEGDNIPNVLHHTVECACRKNLVFVVVCDGNEQFGVSVVHGRAQIVTIPQGEFIGVASRSRVW